jgi:hypothetical protein
MSPSTVASALVLVAAVSCVAPPDDSARVQGAVLDVCATAPEGALCDDGNPCTLLDVCKAGVCQGSPAPDGTLCTDGNTCTANDSCRLGTCKGDPVPDTTPCTDGDPCTVGDSCTGGVCVSGTGMLSCDDGVACTLDSCVAGVGCEHTPVGDCSLPMDAGPEVRADAKSDATDARATPDAPADAPLSMPGGDGAVDAPAVSDAPLDALPPADVAPPIDAPTDLVVQADVASPLDAPAFDAGADAGDGAAGSGGAGGAAGGAGTSPLTLPELRASGGACACALSGAPELGVSALLALSAALVLARRRRH